MKDESDELPEEEDHGVLVGGGSFKVDRVRALELMGRYRSADAGPVMFLARAAAASEANRFNVAWKGAVLEASFDGTPFSHAELADPYGALFEGSSRSAARSLAQALLHAFRPGLMELSVTSGSAEASSTLTASGTASEKVEKDTEPRAGTLIRLVCARRDDSLLAHPVPATEIACRPQSHFWGRMPSEFHIDDTLVGSYAPREAGLGEIFDEKPGGPRILLALLPPPESRGLLDLYHHGVYAGRLRAADGCPDVLGKVDDPELRLNASHTSLVRSPRVTDLKDRCRLLAWDLVGKVAAEQTERMPATLALLRSNKELRDLWRRRFARGADAEFDLHERGPLGPEEDQVLHDAAATSWLRAAATQFGDKAALRVREALAKAPLFISTGYKTLSSADIRGRGEEIKAVAKLGGGLKGVWAETAYQGTLLRKLR